MLDAASIPWGTIKTIPMSSHKPILIGGWHWESVTWFVKGKGPVWGGKWYVLSTLWLNHHLQMALAWNMGHSPEILCDWNEVAMEMMNLCPSKLWNTGAKWTLSANLSKQYHHDHHGYTSFSTEYLIWLAHFLLRKKELTLLFPWTPLTME